jgi:hypothetical protein
LLFPKGNNVDHLSIYLDVADSASLPYGWSRFAHFSLAVVNQYDPKITVKKGAPLLMHLCFVSKRESLVLLWSWFCTRQEIITLGNWVMIIL